MRWRRVVPRRVEFVGGWGDVRCVARLGSVALLMSGAEGAYPPPCGVLCIVEFVGGWSDVHCAVHRGSVALRMCGVEGAHLLLCVESRNLVQCGLWVVRCALAL